MDADTFVGPRDGEGALENICKNKCLVVFVFDGKSKS